MAVVVVNTGSDWTLELYDQVIAKVIPDPDNLPAGMKSHAASMSGSGLRVIDVWESEDAWNSFREETVIPAAQEIGAPPFDSEVTEAHNVLIG